MSIQDGWCCLADLVFGRWCSSQDEAGLNARNIQKSQSVEIDDNATIPTKFLIPVPDKIDKISLKEAMKHGAVLPGIRLVEKNNIQIR